MESNSHVSGTSLDNGGHDSGPPLQLHEGRHPARLRTTGGASGPKHGRIMTVYALDRRYSRRVNWLTERVAQIPSFGGLASRASRWRSGLNTVDVDAVLNELLPLGVAVDAGDVDLTETVLLVADAAAAADRRRGVRPAVPGRTPPADFTVALDDGFGTVVYLPDDVDESMSLQLFTVVHGPVVRRVATGLFDGSTARLLDQFEPELRGLCSDGPCPDPECPDGCDCVTEDVTDTLGAPRLAALPPRYTADLGRVYVDCCMPDDQ